MSKWLEDNDPIIDINQELIEVQERIKDLKQRKKVNQL
jgi:hypothetical protein